MTHISKRSRKTYSSRMAPAHSQKKFAWNGQAVFAPRLAALSSAPCVLFSIAVWASMARRRLIALCVMNWRICSRNLAQVDVGSRRTGRNGSGPAPILELPGKRAVTISPSRFDVRRVGIFTRARIAGAVLHGRGDCAAHPPVLLAAAHSIGAATISDSSSNSFGARQRISLLRLSMFDRVQKGSVGRAFWGAHAPRVHRLAPRRTDESSMAASWSFCARNDVRGGAPQTAREGACAPQICAFALLFQTRAE